MYEKKAKIGEPRFYRIKAKLSLAEAAAAADLAEATLSNLENLKNLNPSITTLSALAEVYAPRLNVRSDGIFLAMAKFLLRQRQRGDEEEETELLPESVLETLDETPES
jgi:transcriptional regulator with XRE-family HTH domain